MPDRPASPADSAPAPESKGSDLTAGWARPGLGVKWHYFLAGDTRSLCSKWLYFGPREEGNDGSPDNCADCRKRKLKVKGVAHAD